MISTDGTVGLTERIVDDTRLVKTIFAIIRIINTNFFHKRNSNDSYKENSFRNGTKSRIVHVHTYDEKIQQMQPL